MVQSADVFMLKYGDGVISNFYFNEKMSFSCEWTALLSLVSEFLSRNPLQKYEDFFIGFIFLFYAVCSEAVKNN